VVALGWLTGQKKALTKEFMGALNTCLDKKGWLVQHVNGLPGRDAEHGGRRLYELEYWDENIGFQKHFGDSESIRGI
jgi:hypothetical protein